MHFHIVGPGAIGNLIAYYLRTSLPREIPISLIHRNAEQALWAARNSPTITVETSGIKRTTDGLLHESYNPSEDAALARYRAGTAARKAAGRPGRPPPRILTSKTAALTHTPRIDSLIITTKAFLTVPIVNALRTRLSSSSTIVLLQNGMGMHEALLEKVFRNSQQCPHFVVACNTHGAWQREHGHTVHTGKGAIQFGIMPDPRGRNYEEHLNEGGLLLDDICPATADPGDRYMSLRKTMEALTGMRVLNPTWKPIYDVEMARRRKLVVNSVINPLTALMGCRNGAVLRTPSGQHICEAVCREASRAFKRQWEEEMRLAADVETFDELPEDVKRSFPTSLRPPSLIKECERIVDRTKYNFSSMMVDIKKGKHTEINELAGYLVALGEKYGVKMPSTSMLLDLIKMRETIPIDISR